MSWSSRHLKRIISASLTKYSFPVGKHCTKPRCKHYSAKIPKITPWHSARLLYSLSPWICRQLLSWTVLLQQCIYRLFVCLSVYKNNNKYATGVWMPQQWQGYSLAHLLPEGWWRFPLAGLWNAKSVEQLWLAKWGITYKNISALRSVQVPNGIGSLPHCTYISYENHKDHVIVNLWEIHISISWMQIRA